MRTVFLALAMLLTCRPATASVSVDGASGILATPTAEVVADGHAVFRMGRYLSDSVKDSGEFIARTYSATIGYLPNLEVTARFSDYPTLPDNQGTTNFQDRSVSAKYQLLQNEEWSFAVGALDFGGESRVDESYYGVVSFSGFDNVQLSAGAGSGALEGVFGSLRYAPSEYVSLLGEYDGSDFNYGLELQPLKGWTLKGGMVNDHAAYTVSYTFPMDARGKQTPCCPVQLERCQQAYPDACAESSAVRDALVAESFENVLVGSADGTLSVDFESRRFVEQLDALAVAAAIAATRCGPETEYLALTPKIDDVPQLTLRVGVEDFLAFLADPQHPCEGFSVTAYSSLSCLDGAAYATEANKKNWHGEALVRVLSGIELATPNLPSARTRTGLGLEENVFLGRGLRLRARQDWSFFNDIEEKTAPVNRDAVLSYFDAWNPSLYVYGAGGYLGNDRYGGMGQVAQYFNGTRFKLGARYAYIRDERSWIDDAEDGLALGEAGYYEPNLDWELTALGGNFLEGDQGLRVESTRYFGPTSLTFFAYDSDKSEPSGGFTVFIPLPWYAQRKHADWRFDGSPYFAFQYRADKDAWGDLPLPGLDISTARQRLRPEYVELHLAEMRRAVALFFSAE